MVADRFKDLLSDNPKMTWVLPDWFIKNKSFIIGQILPFEEQILIYQQWHDCGKPYCKVIDAEGRIHYPDHAGVSGSIWNSLGGDALIGEFIARDMECHLLKPSEAKEYAKKPHAIIMLISALCETHANAQMFGGFDSESFKIKYKRLDKSGDRILNQLQNLNTI